MSNLTQQQNTSQSRGSQLLTVPFTSRSHAGKIDITIEANSDPEHAAGLDLIFSHLKPSSFAAQLHGFPVVKATIDYPIPPSPFSSYASLFGWIQFVKYGPMHPSSDASQKSGTGEWEMDIFPYAKDLKSPFCYWGYNPTAFDAPARLLKEDDAMEEVFWRAQSFLCVLEDAGVTKCVKLVEGAGFTWGFDIETFKGSEETGLQRKITVKRVEVMDVEKEWAKRLALLRDLYPDWTFRDVGEKEANSDSGE